MSAPVRLLAALAAVSGGVTAAGRIALTIGGVSWLLAAGLGWSEFSATAWTVTLMFAFSAAALAGGAGHAVHLELPTPRVSVGRPASLHVVVGNRRRTALGVSSATVSAPFGDVTVALPALAAGESSIVEVPLPTDRRGVFVLGPTEVGRRDPLRLLRRRSSTDQRVEQFVHPATVPLRGLAAGARPDLDGIASRELSSRDIAFHSIREYARGDDPRTVHWRSTAKSGRLMVRRFEQSRRSALVVLLDVRTGSYNDADGFELAVSAVATLAEHARRERRAVHVASNAREVGESAINRGALLDALARVGLEEGADPIAQLARRSASTIPDAASVVIVGGGATPYRDWRSAAEPFARSVVVAVRCEAGARPAGRAGTDPEVVTIGSLSDLARIMAEAAGR